MNYFICHCMFFIISVQINANIQLFFDYQIRYAKCLFWTDGILWFILFVFSILPHPEIVALIYFMPDFKLVDCVGSLNEVTLKSSFFEFNLEVIWLLIEVGVASIVKNIKSGTRCSKILMVPGTCTNEIPALVFHPAREFPLKLAWIKRLACSLFLFQLSHWRV